MGLWITPSDGSFGLRIAAGLVGAAEEIISKSLALRCFGDPATGVMQLKAVKSAGCLVRHDSIVASRVIRKFRSNEMDVECKSASIWAGLDRGNCPRRKRSHAIAAWRPTPTGDYVGTLNAIADLVIYPKRNFAKKVR